MGSQTIRVLLLDDHTMVRQGIKILLEEFEGICVVGQAAHGVKSIEMVEHLRPDVVLMDLSRPGMDGLEAIHRILAVRPEQRIILLTGTLDDRGVFQAIRAGALGCIEKTTNPEELVQAIRDVCSGRPSVSPSVAWRVLRGSMGPVLPGQRVNRLSAREVEILRLLTLGKLDREIARELVLTEVTVRTHISRILSKLGLENRVQAARYCLRTGLVSISEISEMFESSWK